MAYLTTIMQANEPIKKFQEAIVRLQESRVSAHRIETMLNEDSEVPESKLNLPFPKNWSSIEYKNIDFSYNSEHPLIQNFNLTVKKGQTVAFVGESGSGKTTLANLLARFYDPQYGEILIGEVNTKDIRLSELRRNIGLVSQEVFLFSDTVSANIKAGSEQNLTSEQIHNKIISSAKAAHAYDFINKTLKNLTLQ